MARSRTKKGPILPLSLLEQTSSKKKHTTANHSDRKGKSVSYEAVGFKDYDGEGETRMRTGGPPVVSEQAYAAGGSYDAD